MLRRKAKGGPVDALRALPTLAGLPEKELRVLANAGTVVRHTDGHSIVRQGDRGVGFHILLEGQVSVAVDGSEVATLGPGACFGELAMLNGGPRTATVTTAGEASTFAVPAWAFDGLLARAPTLARDILREVSSRTRGDRRSE